MPAITLEVLPAGYGDCLLIECPVGDRTWRMLIDTGPDETYPTLKARVAQLPAGQRHIDLFIVSHIDHDHIGGAGLLLNDESLGLTFGDIWFNAPPVHRVRGVVEGQSLATILGAADRKLPWNVAFDGKAAATAGKGHFVEVTQADGTPTITLLSPTPERLADLFKVWDKELERLRRKETDKPAAAPLTRGAAALDIEALAAKITGTDRAVPNGSSIAILLEHQGASVLLGADAFPTVLTPALQAFAAHRKVAGPLKVDVVKLSHHGSRANTTNELLGAVQGRHYVFSTNNAIFNHPDDETVSRVLVHGGNGPQLWFNYATDRNKRWAAPELTKQWGYRVHHPDSVGQGVVIELKGSRP